MGKVKLTVVGGDSPSTTRILAHCPKAETDVSVYGECQGCEYWNSCFGDVSLESVLQEAFWREFD